MTTRLETEVERMQRVPGISFVDGAAGRRAHVAGTGLDVFEVIKIYREGEENWDRLRVALHWLTDAQLQTALAYAREYPADVYARVEAEESFDIEEFWRQHPATAPRH